MVNLELELICAKLLKEEAVELENEEARGEHDSEARSQGRIRQRTSWSGSLAGGRAIKRTDCENGRLPAKSGRHVGSSQVEMEREDLARQDLEPHRTSRAELRRPLLPPPSTRGRSGRRRHSIYRCHGRALLVSVVDNDPPSEPHRSLPTLVPWDLSSPPDLCPRSSPPLDLRLVVAITGFLP
uniref:Uncharacterized protein n=1 Tax=Oryza sativa subsp. japonica TaxID=39947 RepID=Q6ER64_ORYSJ|nr:hypothetical protein [Oryza sativa Japonica Group]